MQEYRFSLTWFLPNKGRICDYFTAWKESVFRVFLVRILPHFPGPEKLRIRTLFIQYLFQCFPVFCNIHTMDSLISGHHRDLLWPREGYFKGSEFLGYWILKFKTEIGILNTCIRIIRHRSKGYKNLKK